MKRRLAWAFICVASGMISLSTVIFIIGMHYHLSLFLKEIPLPNPQVINLSHHFEQALIQSIIWTAIGTICLAMAISFYVAKKITSPLIEMRRVAEKITQGNLEIRIKMAGKDELSDLGQALNHLTDELKKQESLRRNLTSDIAHELRTPLATLKSHMEAFEDGIWEPTPERIRSCYEELERLIHLVGDLEQLTNVESPGFKLKKKEECLSEIVEQSVKTMETAFITKDVELLNFATAKIPIFVDRNRMIQILINLLSNALKFTPSGGKVIVDVKEEGEKVIIIVKDTGIGIPTSEIPKVFERFYRVDKSRNLKLGGSGIGLTIVKKLVEAHEGTVDIESDREKGTSVIITLKKMKSTGVV
ncbi:sensor histidine kinase [Laceyella putida]|uniref:histidine kinase n=1 Tax=Laceyella putida TaxID=110101 RepID=A0ABW2RGZ8_9BACL